MIKIKNFLAVLLVLISAFSYAQLPNITLLGSTTTTASGAGASGIPALTWNIPGGKNRVMIVTFWFERDHRPNAAQNYASNLNGSSLNYFPLSVNGNSVTGLVAGGTYYKLSTPPAVSSTNADFSSTYYRYVLTEADGLPTGLATFDFSGINSPKNTSDDVAVSVAVFGNVSPTNTYASPFTSSSLTTTTSISNTTNAAAAASPQNGRSLADNWNVGFAGITQDISLSANAGWTIINNFKVTNNNGSPLLPAATPTIANEPDGLSMLMAYSTGEVDKNFITNRGSDNTSVLNFRHVFFRILPLASPSVSGQVVTPTLNSSTGTQGGGLYVNVVDKSTNEVVAVVVVDASGNFTIPVGTLIENYNYDFILSKNAGTVGTTNPITVALNAGWVTVAEGVDGATSDGTANSIFNFTMGAANVNTLRFAINYVCNAGTAQVPLSGNTIQN